MFYTPLLATDLLLDLDRIQILPASIYSMLFHISVYAPDISLCNRAFAIYMELIQRHIDFRLDLIRCLPRSDEFISVWKQYGTFVTHF